MCKLASRKKRTRSNDNQLELEDAHGNEKRRLTFIHRLEGFDERQVSDGEFVITSHPEGVGCHPLRRPEGVSVAVDGMQDRPHQKQPPKLVVRESTIVAAGF